MCEECDRATGKQQEVVDEPVQEMLVENQTEEVGVGQTEYVAGFDHSIVVNEGM